MPSQPTAENQHQSCSTNRRDGLLHRPTVPSDGLHESGELTCGQQTTLTEDNGAAVGDRIDLLIDRARAGECDLVVKGGGEHGEKGYLYDVASDRFLGNRRADASLSDANLRQRAFRDGGELTYTCVPPGSGVRIGIDHDEDGYLDGDEEDAGSDPADAASVPRRSGGGGKAVVARSTPAG